MAAAFGGGMGERAETASGPDGAFTLTGLTSAQADLVAAAEGYAEAVKKGVAVGSTGVEFLLPDLGTISGKVVDAAGPRHGVRGGGRARHLALRRRARLRARGRAQVAGDGTYRVIGLPAGSFAVSVYSAATRPPTSRAWR